MGTISHLGCRCPAEKTLDLLHGRWKVPILWELFDAPVLRFSELRRRLYPCTQKMLAQHLREMERDGLVKRKVFAQVPPRVEYSLTPAGKSLRPVVQAMVNWAQNAPRGRSSGASQKRRK
jgi:DNA-binding HxlR family transcriptional regulator